jgi:hypothetical protein
MKAALLMLFALGCGGDENTDADAIPCRSDCSRAAAPCSNACNDDPSPGICRTACAANELGCQKVCEAQFPGEDSIRCKSDCDRFGATCNNGCEDSACRSACANRVQTCKLECYGLYGE